MAIKMNFAGPRQMPCPHSSLANCLQNRFNPGMTRYAPLLLALLAPLLTSMSQKKEYSITFHAQGEGNDMSKTMFPFELEGRRVLFKIVPEMSQQNIVSFHPFPAENGNKNGVAFQMDFRGKSALEIATRTRKGEYLLAMVNGLPVDYVILDEVITDGFVTIWQGVPDEIIKTLDKKFSRIKPGQSALTSSDRFDDMAPTTKKEKKRALEDAKQAEKAAKKAEKDARAGKTPKEIPTPQNTTIPKLPVTRPENDAPVTSTTNAIPVEGAPASSAATVKPAPAKPAPAPVLPPQTRGTPLPPDELGLPKAN